MSPKGKARQQSYLQLRDKLVHKQPGSLLQLAPHSMPDLRILVKDLASSSPERCVSSFGMWLSDSGDILETGSCALAQTGSCSFWCMCSYELKGQSGQNNG